MSDKLFEIATREKYTFPSPAGLLSTEQLWDLPLTATDASGKVRLNVASLDTVARLVNAQVKAGEEESFVPSSAPDTAAQTNVRKLDLVKYVIAVKVQERDEAARKAANKTRRAAILAQLALRDQEALSAASREDLMRELDALD